MTYPAIVLALLLAIFAPSMTAWGSIVVTDDDNRHITLPHPPKRIISLAPGATEMLFAAGAAPFIIGTVEYSDTPAAALKVPRIGDGIAVDMERVVAMRPDIVVVWPGGGNPAQIAKLESLGLPLYRQQVDTLADLPASLRRLGALAGTQLAAERSARDIEARLAELKRRYGGGARLSVLMQVWDHPIYTVGGKHLITDSLRLCGARNIFADLPEMGPAVDTEAVIARDPDVIVAAAPAGAAREWLAQWRKFPSLRAVRSGRLIAFEDQGLSRLGPSVVTATEALCKDIGSIQTRGAHP